MVITFCYLWLSIVTAFQHNHLHSEVYNKVIASQLTSGGVKTKSSTDKISFGKKIRSQASDDCLACIWQALSAPPVQPSVSLCCVRVQPLASVISSPRHLSRAILDSCSRAPPRV